MTSQTAQDKHDEWLSRIALELGKHHTPLGERPDLEDFAALLDDRLSHERRQEVISHLANDSELYNQWQYLVSNHVHWQEAPLTAASNVMQSSPSENPIARVTNQITRWAEQFGQWVLKPIPMGGMAMASVAVVSVLILTPNQQPYPLDEAYKQYSTELSSYLDQQPVMRGFPAKISAEATEVLAGLHAGQQSLGFSTSVATISEVQLQQAADAYQKLHGTIQTENYRLGRWLLLATALCGQDRESLSSLDTNPAGDSLVLSNDLNLACKQIDTYLHNQVSKHP
ncbi:MAG: hypothetical protein ACRBBW_14025 [Cellvibrionaceae bacterium]